MKTSIVLDDEKVKLAKKLGHHSTLKELIDKALEAYIAQARRQNMLEILGKRFFEGDLSAMRGKNGSTRR